VALATTRLDQPLIYEPDDLTISVGAGITLQALNSALAANGQMLPLDGPWPARSTVGGVLATGVDGPRRLLYGTSRDLLIGIKVVEATGRVSKAGGMVVKNVSGFDMMKLYLGSLGTLGVIVSANFKLMPRPRAAATLVCAFDAPMPAQRLAELIAESQLTPAGVVYVEGWSADERASHPVSLLVRAEGLAAAVERHLRDVSAMAEAAGAASVTAHSDPGERQALDLVSDLAHPVSLESGLALRLGCLPGSLAAALADARELARRHALQLRVVAYALSGVAYLRVDGDDIPAWYNTLLARWPQLTVTAAPPALAAELPVWGVAPANLELMGRIKNEFDPDNTLNPGRFVV
jgi:glycolate oxidase FAD binding subunit